MIRGGSIRGFAISSSSVPIVSGVTDISLILARLNGYRRSAGSAKGGGCCCLFDVVPTAWPTALHSAPIANRSCVKTPGYLGHVNNSRFATQLYDWSSAGHAEAVTATCDKPDSIAHTRGDQVFEDYGNSGTFER